MDQCDHIYFYGVFTMDMDKYFKRAECRLKECMFPARYCAAKYQNELELTKNIEWNLSGVKWE